MAHRLLIQVAVTGAQVFGRAFTEAYKQAAATTAKQSASRAARATNNGMPVDEACNILNIEQKDLTLDKAQEKYDYLFNINAKENGGSFYLQSKVYRAMEQLKSEIEFAQAVREEEAAAKAESAEGGAEKKK
ncbi:hypothetical protein BABINDRAFT_160349 [Babjeviella inositovora NRRL Y-12698]|uniref:Mitochondrial import inner membrane translocase subunit TIM16 n=1 Tax=Babjeviella inositovora NRRL Y-12698 TaxID=984486 RepID=A0A1E3QT64_9ASCO|nr:uncharacterized protein BABINDRAFT_160349 [Babjeviella inositovora NRRL Y-12698]ODQ80903.1 hypothetical protein BABINDRAFT_160349 [Babjeviella inositovora NRRL Y-12698]